MVRNLLSVSWQHALRQLGICTSFDMMWRYTPSLICLPSDLLQCPVWRAREQAGYDTNIHKCACRPLEPSLWTGRARSCCVSGPGIRQPAPDRSAMGRSIGGSQSVKGRDRKRACFMALTLHV